MRAPSYALECAALFAAIVLAALLGATLARAHYRAESEPYRLVRVLPPAKPLPHRTCLQVRPAKDGSPFYVPVSC